MTIFTSFNELMDLGNDCQWLQISQKERQPDTVYRLVEVPLKKASKKKSESNQVDQRD